MRIGLDGSPLAQVKTGVGHYTYELATALARHSPSDHFELLSHLPFDSAALHDGQDRIDNLTFIAPNINWLTKHWWTIGLPRYLGKRKLDLFHGTNYDVPVMSRCPTVLTIHDLSLLLHSSTHERRRVRRARRRLPIMARLASMIIVPTLSIRDEVCAHLGVAVEKTRVVPYAPRRVFTPVKDDESVQLIKRLGIEGDFLLYVGTIEPRKDLITLVRAFETVLESGPGQLQLVLVGKKGWLTDEFFNYLERSPARERTILTGYIDDLDIARLYSVCTLMIFPAIYEGGGLPPLEAMACGAAVITTNTPAISEMVGDAAKLFPAQDHQELARCIVELLNDERQRKELSRRGLERAAQFTWERTATLTYDVYREVMGTK